MRKEYVILSSISNGLNESYKSYEELKERVQYIKNNKELFKHNSMLFIYIDTYNENGKITDWEQLEIIDFNKLED